MPTTSVFMRCATTSRAVHAAGMKRKNKICQKSTVCCMHACVSERVKGAPVCVRRTCRPGSAGSTTWTGCTMPGRRSCSMSSRAATRPFWATARRAAARLHPVTCACSAMRLR
jgi:hypothetical protein